MLTIGVDLAAAVKGTTVALVDWDAGQATVTGVHCPAGDDVILDAMAKAGKVGIDSPLGWSRPHRPRGRPRPDTPPPDGSRGRRRVHRGLGRLPLPATSLADLIS
ncbi:MAG TPA: hypothetical protein VI365_29525 [Trebonia sp.]